MTENFKDESSDQKNDFPGKGNYNDWGYDLFPERRGEFETKWGNVLIGLEGGEATDRMKCERRVIDCFKKSSLVKLMLGALKSAGCEINLRRHIVCEVCDPSVTGGYDPVLNQIVVCQNNAKSNGIVQGILTHEMLHMFDFCKNQVNFRNLEHLACTEIRAANLCHCSLTTAILQGDCSPINFKKRHEICVKNKALQSVLAVRKSVSKEEAMLVIDKVFNKCYNDLEPIGRRVKGSSTDSQRAYLEGFLYGYE